MENLLLQLQNLQNIFTQWQASITAQQHHLTLLIHIIQTHSNNAALSDSIIEESINNIIQSNAEIVKAINNTVLSLEQTEISSNNVTLSNIHKTYESNQTSLSNVEKGLDTKHIALSNVEKGLDTKHITLSNVEKGLDTKHITLSNTEKGLDTKHITLSNMVTELDINKVNNGLLKQKLSTLLPKSSDNTKQNAIKILFALYQNPKQTHQDLITITQLSKGGLNKHLMMLKKQNIIERSAYQEYKPTSFILGIMKECMQ